MFKKITLRNGLRIIVVPMRNTRAVTALVLVGIGSKYETKEINGISHFLEHMFFKGTKRRPHTFDIAKELDRIGGIYNAFTGKEYTGYFVKVDFSHLDLALDVISDIFFNSLLASKEIIKEKKVILEEIKMCRDTPLHYIGDLWEELLYKGQPAGWHISGTPETVSAINQKKLKNFLKTHYFAQNTVIGLAGRIDPEKGVEKIRKYFGKIKKGKVPQRPKVIEKQKKSETLLHYKKTDQTHLTLGVRGYNFFHPQRYAFGILGVILGGNMSSRLFISLREKKGLAYYIKTESHSDPDSGYLVTQAGVDHRRIGEAISLILKEYKKIALKRISEEELNRAKDYIKGTMILGLEPSEALVSFYTSQELLEEKILTPKEKLAKIDEVTIRDIQKVAKEIFQPQKLNLALIGPLKDKNRFQRLLKI